MTQQHASYEPGQKFALPIRSRHRYGFFVDIPDGDKFLEGFVHVTQIHHNPAHQTVDAIPENQLVTVWVLDAVPVGRRLALTMIDPTPRTPISALRVGQEVAGQVKNVLDNRGAFVDIGAERDGLIDISAMRPTRVSKASDVLRSGDKVKGWVQWINLAKREFYLSLMPPPSLQTDQLYEGKVLFGVPRSFEHLPAGDRWEIHLDVGDFEAEGWVFRPGLIFKPPKLLTEGQEERFKVRTLTRNSGTNKIDQIWLELLS